MKKIAVEDAIGMELCHDITAIKDNFKGPILRRGHVIRPQDIDTLLDCGKKHVFVWEKGAGEIHEEDAALRMAAMCPVALAEYSGPSEGKMMLTAKERGMFRVDKDLLLKLTAIGDITICTLPDHYPVEKGKNLASMRIVPLVTKEEQIIEAEKLCEGKKLLDLKPYKELKVGIIITGSEIYSGRIQDKFEPVIRKKLQNYPSEILGVSICDDKLEMIKNAAQKYLSMGAGLLIFTGGMSVDPDDLTPTAIRELGAEIISYGVPAQPGNMSLVAYLGDTAILGVPGAAVKKPTTMFDVLLPQVFTGEKFTKKELICLGDGGLCQSCAECHWPNCSFGKY